MPVVETKGAASSQGFGQTVGTGVTYIENVFSTYVYTGNGTKQTINNGIDLSGKGGMLWIKSRSSFGGGPINSFIQQNSHYLFDTNRTNQNALCTQSSARQDSSWGNGYINFNSQGFDTGTATGNVYTQDNNNKYTSWTFRESKKFFDVVTYTGNGSNRTIAHNLGIVPGCIIVKRLDSSGDWQVYHRSLANTEYMVLNTTAAKATGATRWNSTTPTDTVFSIGTDITVNANGSTYVAYLFAHDTSNNGLIQCGSFTTNGSGNASVTLGWEPQWVFMKRTDSAASDADWRMLDIVRGWSLSDDASLFANLGNAEINNTNVGNPTATGFDRAGGANSADYIYIAIRRGPMQKPTSGTSVFGPVVYTGTNVDNRLVSTGLFTDMTFARQRDATTVAGMVVGDRLRGDPYLLTGDAAGEVSDANSFMTPTSGYGNSFSAMNGFGVGNDTTSKLNASTTSNNQVAQGFRRAPSFFDVVCVPPAVSLANHNLKVVPELIIQKRRSSSEDWWVWNPTITSLLNTGVLNSSAAFYDGWGYVGTPLEYATATDFYTYAANLTDTYVCYLFASCPGVSKVGGYTGTGTTQQIDCGFSAGARFVLIKRTDDTGNWYVWDSARGIVASDDPYILLDSTAAEVTNTDYIDTYSAGFEISSTAPADINANGGSFIFIAIA